MRPGEPNPRWTSVALRGAAAILLGILSFAHPNLTFLSLVVVFGAYAIIDGLLTLGLGAARGPVAVRALASIIAGIAALFWPGMTSLVLLFVIATWAIIAGLLEVVMAIALHDQLQREEVLVLEGALSVVFGVVLLIAPASGAIALGLWVGAYALVLGGMLIFAALRLRRPPDRLAAA